MPAVIYPSNLKTDKDKLFACYALIEQLRLEYNKVSAIATSDKEKYIESGKFRVYSDKAKNYFKQLLVERNSLIEKIRWANYTLEEWKQVSKLSFEGQVVIYKTLFGDRQAQQVKPTLATSPLLDDLKATSLDDMPSKLGNDPTENLTTYTEVDTPGRLAETTDRVTATSLTRDDTSYLYKDKGVNYFNANFEHLCKSCWTGGSGYGLLVFWMLANDLGDTYALISGGKSFLYNSIYLASLLFTLVEVDSGTQYQDSSISLLQGTTYYCETERDEGVGTYGTLYNRICTGNYYGLGGSLVDTLSLTLHTSKKDFRYIYGANSRDDGSPLEIISGWMELLDLQEAVAAIVPFRNYYPSILAH